jgi:hypothetical protein
VNIFNHFVPSDPSTNGSAYSIDTPSTFGIINNQFVAPNGAQSRSMEFGLRLRF